MILAILRCTCFRDHLAHLPWGTWDRGQVQDHILDVYNGSMMMAQKFSFVAKPTPCANTPFCSKMSMEDLTWSSPRIFDPLSLPEGIPSRKSNMSTDRQVPALFRGRLQAAKLPVSCWYLTSRALHFHGPYNDTPCPSGYPPLPWLGSSISSPTQISRFRVEYVPGYLRMRCPWTLHQFLYRSVNIWFRMASLRCVFGTRWPCG